MIRTKFIHILDSIINVDHIVLVKKEPLDSGWEIKYNLTIGYINEPFKDLATDHLNSLAANIRMLEIKKILKARTLK